MEKFLKPDRFDSDPSCSSATQQWRHWFHTFENFKNSITADQRNDLQLLTNYVSPSIYAMISESKSYADAIKTLKDAFDKPKNEIFARHCLATHRQQPGESIDTFLQSLRTRAKDCNFQAVSAEKYLEESIRDAFITGLLSQHIRQRLLENSQLDLSTAVSQARALEMAQSNSEKYPQGSSVTYATSSDNSLTNNAQCLTPNSSMTAAMTNQKCFFCGNTRHPRASCPARDAVCHNCNKKGHFSKVCKASKSKQVSAVLPSSSLATITACSINSISKAQVDLTIEHHWFSGLIDTGSSDNFIKNSVAMKLGLKVIPTTWSVTLANTSHHTEIKGYCHANLSIKTEQYKGIKLFVMDNLCCDILLGHDFMKCHKTVSIHFGGERESLSVCNLLSMVVEPPSLFTDLVPDVHPISIPSRRRSSEDEHFIVQEIERMLKEEIIEPSHSSWRAQVLVTKNDRHKKRLVIDYSQTINKFTRLNAYPIPRIDDLIQKIAAFRVFSALDLRSAYHQIPIKQEDKVYTAFEACGSLFQFCRLPFGLTNAVSCFQKVMNEFIKSNDLHGVFAYLDDVLVCGTTLEDHNKNLEKFKAAAEKFKITLNDEKCFYSQTSINFLGYHIENGQIRPDPSRLQPLRDLSLPNDSKSLQRTLGLFSYYSKWIPCYSDKIKPLLDCSNFPLNDTCISAIDDLKEAIENSVLSAIDESVPFVVETDASDFAVAGTLSQNGRPVAFFSRTLNQSELRQSSVEKEACAIIESVRRWRHYLTGRSFILITDQKSVSYMFDAKNHGKIKNDKIIRWRVELSCYSYDILYRPGKQNVAADALSRGVCHSINNRSLLELHEALCHPGVTRLLHFVKEKNLPFSTEEVRKVCSSCRVCAETKPRFYVPTNNQLIKATQPFERISMDFVGPKQTVTKNKYLLVLVDEFSRFPFVFPCANMYSSTVISCLKQLFSLFGMPAYVHSDRGSQFMSKEVSDFLMNSGVAQSRTTPYNPRGNGQCERLNGTIWKTIQLGLKSKNLTEQHWEFVLPEALHAIRSLLCTSTNSTPHERFFNFARRSSSGSSIPSWLMQKGPVLLKNFVRSKSDPLVEEVELLQATPSYAHVKRPSGVETTVSLRDLAPLPTIVENEIHLNDTSSEDSSPHSSLTEGASELKMDNENFKGQSEEAKSNPLETGLRRSTRASVPPDRLLL